MRTRNALERLAAVAPTEPLIDAGDQDRILARIVASERRPAPAPARRRLLLALAGVAVLAAAAIAASLEIGHASHVRALSSKRGGHVVLSGARIEAAGYHFRTPAGFAPSHTSCIVSSSSGPVSVMNGFAVAASADGGCVEAFFLIGSDSSPADNGATPVDVGGYQGYYVPPDAAGESTLYVGLPKASGGGRLIYLVLYAEKLTEDQLIAVAQSGLPASP